MNQSIWPEADDKLRAMWAEGLSTLQIGSMLRVTKNAIIGRARRIGLPARPSPIKGEQKPRRLRQARTPDAKPQVGPMRGDTLAALAAPAERPVVVRPLVVLAPWLSKPIPPSRSCCWPIGEPRKPGFRFCEAVSVPGFSYCPKHKKRAYKARVSLAEKSAAKEAAEKAFLARAATMKHRTPLSQWAGAGFS